MKPENPNKPMPLDELLSPEALKQLNEYGYVQFKIVRKNEGSTLGWISRKMEVGAEHICVSLPSGAF